MDKHDGAKKSSLGRQIVGALVVAIVGGLVGLVFTYHRELYAWVKPPRPKVEQALTATETLEAIAADLERLPSEERTQHRYLVLAHLYDPAVDDAARTGAREAVREAIAWATPVGQVCAIDPVGKHNAIIRVKIADLGWDAKTQWRALLAQYPYGLDCSDHGNESLAAAERRIRKIVPELPYVRGDWFAARLCVPPLGPALKVAKDVPAELGKFARDYSEQPIDLTAASRDLGHQNAKAVRAKIEEEKRLQDKQGLGPLLTGGAITRSAWESRRFGNSPFQDLALSLKLGIPEIIEDERP